MIVSIVTFNGGRRVACFFPRVSAQVGAGFRRRVQAPHGGRNRRRLMTTQLPLGYKPLNRERYAPGM
jgi:hypothetical protein